MCWQCISSIIPGIKLKYRENSHRIGALSYIYNSDEYLVMTDLKLNDEDWSQTLANDSL